MMRLTTLSQHRETEGTGDSPVNSKDDQTREHTGGGLAGHGDVIRHITIDQEVLIRPCECLSSARVRGVPGVIDDLAAAAEHAMPEDLRIDEVALGEGCLIQVEADHGDGTSADEPSHHHALVVRAVENAGRLTQDGVWSGLE